MQRVTFQPCSTMGMHGHSSQVPVSGVRLHPTSQSRRYRGGAGTHAAARDRTDLGDRRGSRADRYQRMCERPHVLLDRCAVRRYRVLPCRHGERDGHYGTIPVEQDGQGRTGVRLHERKWFEHMPDGGSAAAIDGADHGPDRGALDDHVLIPLHGEQRERDYNALVRDLADELHRYIARRAGDDHAEDILGEVFLVVWRRWDVMPVEHDARRAWTYEVAKRTILDAGRRQQRYRRLTLRVAATREQPEVTQPGEAFLSNEAAAHLLAQLPATHSQVLRMTALDGLSAHEIAQMLGLSATAVTTRLHRARAALRDYLSGAERRTP